MRGIPGAGWLAALVFASSLVAATQGLVAQQLEGATPVDSLLARGRLQEAVWTLREAGDTARADSILHVLEGVLRSPPLEARPLGMDSQGVSFTWRLDHGQGVESIFKVDGSDIFCPECGADREVATYRIDRLLGFDLTPATVRTRLVKENGDTLIGSAMYYVHDARTPAEANAEKPDALHVFDAIMGNSDRHKTNWVIAGDRVVAIDHNRAFEYQPSTRPRTCWESQIDSIARPGALGPQWARYLSLPADSFRAALAGLEPDLVERFLVMRERVGARLEGRVRQRDQTQRFDDCPFN
jgi:hypothetical protein